MPIYWNPIIVDAQTVYKVRAKLGLTQAEFAAKMGVARRTVIRWETGGVKFDRYARDRDWRTGKPVKTPAQKFDQLAKKARVEVQLGF